ncbi:MULTISPECIES: sigma factor-like helix-turn-helix DNA-binding protein [Streptomyces]|uniref:sigma factor-like helix-turn-helix DNA-binding protein n=1 Tax=Streptomyces TaxID=1883 RepID=UPI00068D74DF|nr:MULTISPECIES: sigma factor-like helix-turn-helix DNA-binding protein [Streptomyces]
MDEHENDRNSSDDRPVTVRFEDQRPRLRAVAYRLLGTFDEADEAVREAVLRAAREAVRDAGAARHADPPTTTVARICLERLRARETHHRKPWDPWDPWAVGAPNRPHRPEQVTDPGRRALLAADTESPGPDLPLVLDGLTPSERLAYVLHDLFTVPYEEIAGILDRSPAAARQLAGRAGHRVHGAEEMPQPDPGRGREVVASLLTAARAHDHDALLALLDPDVVLRADAGAVRTGATPAHGAPAVARAVARQARSARPALVDGAAGLVVGDPEALSTSTTTRDTTTGAPATVDTTTGAAPATRDDTTAEAGSTTPDAAPAAQSATPGATPDAAPGTTPGAGAAANAAEADATEADATEADATEADATEADGVPAVTVLGFTVLHGLITSVDLLADAEHLSRLDLQLLDERAAA